MFAIERRKHSKTRVYEDLCMRLPVDTPIATDKLKTAKRASNSRGSTIFPSQEKLLVKARIFVSLGAPASLRERTGTRGKRNGRPFLRIDAVGSRSAIGIEDPSRPVRGRRPSSRTLHEDAPDIRRVFRTHRNCTLFETRPDPSTEWFPSPPRHDRQSCGKLESDLPRRALEPSGSLRRREFRPGFGGMRHSLCSMTWLRVGMTVRPRKKLRGEETRRWRNERA